ncbi:MAG: S49 family peptidase [Pseudomonadota bacterium]
MWPFSSKPTVPVVRLTGAIGMATPLRPGLSLALVAGALERAFAMSKLPSVALLVNSPGGSPVQSNLIFRRIRQLAAENQKTVYVFCEDVAASGGYFLAVAGDEIYADPSSIVGSVGVIAAGFGLDKAIEKLGVERRVYTSGERKSILDPFRPEDPDDVSHLKQLQRQIHDVFIGIVKDRRAGKLKAADAELFSGQFWDGSSAMDLGLIDGLTDVRTKMRELHGDKVRLRVVPLAKPGLLARLMRSPGGAGMVGDGAEGRLAFADDLVSAVEERMLWSRYGL